jgi:hypothetical protein
VPLASVSIEETGAKGTGTCEDPRAPSAVIAKFAFETKR